MSSHQVASPFVQALPSVSKIIYSLHDTRATRDAHVNDSLYLHEFIDIIGQQRARYMHHMTAYWVPRSRVDRNQLCYGVWGTFGSTGHWPQTVNIWEYPGGWRNLAKAFDLEFSAPTMQDPTLQEWWATAAKMRSGGYDRLLVPAPWTRTINELMESKVSRCLYAHELIRLPQGNAVEFMDAVQKLAVPALEGLGLESVGAFRVAMRADTEVILLWSFPDSGTWADFESAWSSASETMLPWRAALRESQADLTRILLVPSPLNPMNIGRQPVESDQRPLEDFFPPWK